MLRLELLVSSDDHYSEVHSIRVLVLVEVNDKISEVDNLGRGCASFPILEFTGEGIKVWSD